MVYSIEADLKSIVKTATGRVLFINTNDVVVLSLKLTDQIEINMATSKLFAIVNGESMYTFTVIGLVDIDGKPYTALVQPNFDVNTYITKVRDVYEYLNSTIFIGCCTDLGTLSVQSYADLASFPATGVTDVLYIAEDTNYLYRWNGSAYVQVGGSSGVTSVGLVMPSAFTVSGSPVTSSGNLTVSGAGTTGQYVRGDGSLASFPGSTGGGSSISYYLNGSINQGVFSGNTYYQMNRTPVLGAGTNFTIATNGYISQFITNASDPSQLNIPSGNWNFEMYFQASSAGGSPSFYVELYKYNGSFTLIASSAANPEGITNGTSVDLYTTAVAVPATTLTITDRLAVRVYVVNSGRTITLHTEDSNLCQVITTFSTGLTALNGLTAQVQNLNTGTSGTDFNISSVSDTHTFNIPTASATNRGALSSADWTAFNDKASSDLAVLSVTSTNAREDNWAPTGWPGTTDRIKVIDFTPNNTNNIISLGGLSSPVTGRIITIVNSSTNNLVIIENEATTSTAANRFKLAQKSPYFLMPEREITFLYTGTRWVQFNTHPNQGGFDFYDDFENVNTTAGSQATKMFWGVASGGGAGLASGAENPTDWGVMRLTAGTSLTGFIYASVDYRRFGGNTIFGINGLCPQLWVTKVKIDTLPTALQDWNFNAGLNASSSTVATNGQTGLMWEMPTFASGGVTPAFWNIRITNVTNSLTILTTTSVPITAATYIYLGIFITSSNSGDAIFFYSTDGITYSFAYRFTRTAGSYGGLPFYRLAGSVGLLASRSASVDWCGESFNLKR
jgi:hypothetical protein